MITTVSPVNSTPYVVTNLFFFVMRTCKIHSVCQQHQKEIIKIKAQQGDGKSDYR